VSRPSRKADSARTVALVLAVLAYRRRLRRRDRWSRPRLLAYQEQALARLRTHTYRRSPFYQDFHAGLTDAPLSALPVLTKQRLMDNSTAWRRAQMCTLLTWSVIWRSCAATNCSITAITCRPQLVPGAAASSCGLFRVGTGRQFL
jgi:hypothetical protein